MRRSRMMLDLDKLLKSSPTPVGDILADIATPDAGDFLHQRKQDRKDLFSDKPKKQKERFSKTAPEPRCDFADGKARLVARSSEHLVHSLWRRSVYGQTLNEIKADPRRPEFIAKGMARFIRRCVGYDLDPTAWAVIVPPPRLHADPEQNFAVRTARLIAAKLGIPFIFPLALCRSRQRIDAVYEIHPEAVMPKQKSLILFDDIVTTGSTLKSMHRLLQPMGYALSHFTAIDNKDYGS